MPLGAARITLLAFSPTTVVVEPTVIRRKIGIISNGAVVDTTYSKFGGSSFESTTSNYAYGLTTQDFTTAADWTYEFWFRPSASVSGHAIGLSADTYLAGLSFYQNGTNMVVYTGGNAGGWRYNTGNQSGLTVGVWSHIAVVQSGTNWKFFIDGVEKTSATPGGTMNPPSYITLGGVLNNGSIEYEQGNIDEVRISDSARYTGAFTPSTTPFVNDDNTTLLLHMNGTDGSTFFEDDNGTGRSSVGVSASGNAQIDTAQSKFGGASLQLDGNDDYLTIHGATGSFNDEWVNGSEWTVEYWVRGTSFSGYETHFGDWGDASDRSFFLGSDTGGDIMFFYTDTGGTLDTAIRADSQLSTNTWHHIALVKDSSNFTLYVDGSSVDSGASENIRAQGNPTRIGASATNAEDFVGYIDEVRVSNTARYTGSFTPHTTPHRNDANTLLLLHMDGTDGTTVFRDDNGQVRSPVGLSAQQQVQIDTAQSKFGGSSALFDGGTDDYILVDHNTQSIDYGDDFTYEFWFRTGTLPSLFYMFAQGSGRGDYIALYNKSGTWTIAAPVSDGSTAYTQIRNIGSTPSTNTWYHIALVKDGANLKMFWNGTELTTNNGSAGTMSADKGWDGIRRIGDWAGGSNYAFNGHIDEVRFSKSVRYTSNFTAPTDPFVNDGNTLLLLHMNGTDASTTFIDDNGKSEPYLSYTADPYASSVRLAVPFDSTHEMADASHSIPGSGSTQATLTDGPASSLSTTQVKWSSPAYENSYLGQTGQGAANTYALSTSIPSSSSGTFVIEGWFLASSSTSNANWCISSADSGGRFLFGINSSSSTNYAAENNIGLGDSNWHHVAIVCDAGSKRVYIDGVYKQATTGGNTDWYTTNTGFSTLHIGQFNSGDSNDYQGHIQDLKVTIGSNRGYTGTSTSSANFTLPGSIVATYA